MVYRNTVLQRSAKVTSDELLRLRAEIDALKIASSLPSNEYETLRVMQGGISLIVYKSGKMVYEDNSETMNIIDRIFVLSEQQTSYTYELGSDETGKGEWYGPLVVVCVSVKPSDINELRRIGVKDSKTLSKRGIKIIANELKKNKHVIWKRTLLQPLEYNSMILKLKAEKKNLNDLLAWAHTTAIKETVNELYPVIFSSSSTIRVTIDQFSEEKMGLSLQDLAKKGITIVQKIGGEEVIPVAAASILAKSFFEEEVDKMCQTHGIDFRIAKPAEIPSDIKGLVAKAHFRNVSKPS
jgi:ribonuclease HIII